LTSSIVVTTEGGGEESFFASSPYLSSTPSVSRPSLVQQLLAIFERFPSFIVKLRETIVNKISDHNAARENLVLHLCWLIGEYATPTITNCLVKFSIKKNRTYNLFYIEIQPR